jgi:hypothetical protein
LLPGLLGAIHDAPSMPFINALYEVSGVPGLGWHHKWT